MKRVYFNTLSILRPQDIQRFHSISPIGLRLWDMQRFRITSLTAPTTKKI
jgi:hypothetical protein